jgi:peroxiredoxin
VELESQADELRAQGYGIAVISYDPQEVTAAFTENFDISFPMLSDVGSATIRRFGILNPVPEWAVGEDRDDPAVQADVAKYVSVVNPSERMIGIAFPGSFLLDADGRVSSRFFEDFYIERTTMSNLMVRAGQGNADIAATKISTAHLDLTTYPSDAAVAAGNRFTLILDIVPKPGIHVYAPGAVDYRVIGLTIAEQPFVRVEPVTYPPSEVYHFKPLDERVAVFQRPFRLSREAVLEGQPQAQAAFRGKDSQTISGTLEYQACDDKICFNPVSLPLSWTLGLRSLVLRDAPPK